MNNEKILAVIADTLQVEVESLDSSVDYRSTNWDSLADIIFISKVDEEFGKSIDADALAECKFIDDFVRLVNES